MPSVEQSPPPVRATIPGRYWDSQIYSGNLFLFDRDGGLTTVDWNALVASLEVGEDLRVVADAALLGNHRLYGEGARQLVRDPEVRPILLNKFFRLHGLHLEWDLRLAELQSTIDNPLPFPHNDSEVYYSRVYVGSRSGLYRLDRDRSEGRRRSSARIADMPALSIAAKHTLIAVAAGADGLHQVQVARTSNPRDEPISAEACTTCEWAYSSLVCSDTTRRMFVASYSRVRDETRADTSRRKFIRKFDGIVKQESLFASQHLASKAAHWGAKDKLYRFGDGMIEIVRYDPDSALRPTERFTTITTLPTPGLGNDDGLVAARVAPFGSVLEFDDRLVVLPSVGEPLILSGEPVNWRVFPRSIDYVNHLHVIYEDRLEIWAFTHDYFVDQRTKLFGTEAVSVEED
jgi:hypothetical protein